MVKCWVGAVALICGLVSVASAQRSPIPKKEPLPIRPFRAELALGFGSARGDYHDMDKSPLVRARLGYQLHPNVVVHGFFRYIDVRVDVDWLDVDQSNIDIGAGIRVTNPVAANTRAFSDLEVFRHWERATVDGEETPTNTGYGFGLRGGFAVFVHPKIELAGFVGYNRTTLEFDDGEGTSAWLTFEVGAIFVP